ncbi:hypothetical protein K2X40_02195 [Candidatus Babeliales bacterium]|nr:hypothetical protein [Candidatus Babeliales bacterium]
MNKLIKRMCLMVLVVASFLTSLQADGYQVLYDAYKKLGINRSAIATHIVSVKEAVEWLEESDESLVPVLFIHMVREAVTEGLSFASAKKKRKNIASTIRQETQRLLTENPSIASKDLVVEILCACLDNLYGQELRDKPYVRAARPQRQRTRWELKAYTGNSYEQTRFGATACGDDTEDVIRQECDDDEGFFSQEDAALARHYTTPPRTSWSMGDLFDVADFQ